MDLLTRVLQAFRRLLERCVEGGEQAGEARALLGELCQQDGRELLF